MSKKTGAIILSTVVIAAIVCYFLFPEIRQFINYIGALVTFLCAIIAFFLWWYPHQGPKIPKEIEVDLLYRNNRTCCICRNNTISDGNSSYITGF